MSRSSGAALMTPSFPFYLFTFSSGDEGAGVDVKLAVAPSNTSPVRLVFAVTTSFFFNVAIPFRRITVSLSKMILFLRKVRLLSVDVFFIAVFRHCVLGVRDKIPDKSFLLLISFRVSYEPLTYHLGNPPSSQVLVPYTQLAGGQFVCLRQS